VKNSGNQLLTLVNDVLDIARIEAGGVRIASEEVDVTALLADTRDIMAPLALELGLSLGVVGDGEPITVMTDADKLKQIVRNLVSNAMKFTEAGGSVSLAATRTGDEVAISVRDTGIGIPGDQLGRIFDTFRQVDHPDRPRPPGAGLGLSICRELTQLLGGQIVVESEVGAGSTFTVTLPLTPKPARPGEAPERDA
jgi:signal transduction histidine kinase